MSSKHHPVVWVTGASRGIGAAVGRSFAATGANVVFSGRNTEALRRNAKEAGKNRRRASFVECDVTSERSVVQAYEEIEKRCGAVDVLVNNAGSTNFKTFNETSLEDFDQLLATNLRGTFLCTKAVLPAMLERASGVIINIISVTATATFEKSSVYAATKAGILAMSRGLRAEVRRKGVRVIDVLPGAVETEMWPKGVREKYRNAMMQPEDIAEIVVSAYHAPRRALIEEILIRPVGGDL